MKIVALETTMVPGSLALAVDGTALWHGQLMPHEKSAETLAICLQAGIRQLSWSVPEVQLVGVTVGPGSFTGLRVGVTTAKMLAYVAGCPVAPIDAMLAIAAGVPDPPEELLVVVDAQRRGFYCQRFQTGSSDIPQPAGPREIWSADRVLREPRQLTLVGPGLARLTECLANRNVAASDCWAPHAQTVALLAWRAASRHDVVDPFQLVLDYGAPSAAEETSPRKPSS